MQPSAITTSGLTKTYASAFGRKKIHALKGIDIEVAQGEIVGILGPNGAGKTTLLKILLGVVSPTSGSGTILGKPLADEEARRRLGYLPENHRFPPYLTARQTLDIYGRLSHLSDSYRKERIPLLLEEAGLGSWIDTRVGKFSKGMMQRLGLAQATLNDPDILVLDEPTDGVDPVGRREIRDRLRILKQRGKTILINSHLLTEIELICDRVAIMNKGLIVRAGSIDEIASEGTGWRIQCRNMPLELDIKRFSAHIEDGNAEQTIILEAGLLETLNALIDELRSHDVTIVSVERHRKSLEAGFLDIIDKESANV
ncbi:ABC transporter ATP-binding protein [bacterium]|nr:ABC transporter ATP-binding protein [bacterium]